MPAVVPHSVELGVEVEQGRRLLERLGSVLLFRFLSSARSEIGVAYQSEHVLLQLNVGLDLADLLEAFGLLRLL